MAELIVSNGKTQDWAQVYQEIKQDYEEAYACIDKAIKLDEEGKFNEALPMYEFGLNLIDKALGVSIECPTQPDINWEKTHVMIQKMRKTRKEIQIRIDEVQSKPHPDAIEPPPSYEEAIAAEIYPSTSNNNMDVQIPGTSKQNHPYMPPSAAYDAVLANAHNVEEPAPSYSDLNNQLGDLKISTEKEILYSHDNVRLYFIAPDGRVSATSEPNTLIIGKIVDPTLKILDEALIKIVNDLKKESNEAHEKRRHHRRHGLHRRRHRHHRGSSHDYEEQGGSESGRIFLQCGSWVYPLIPEVSPCYRSDFGAFILPDVHSGIQGSAVGIMLPEDADETVHELLNFILNGAEQEGPKRPRRTRRTATDHKPVPVPRSSISSNIVKGATYIANSLVRGAGSTARFIDTNTPKYIIDKIQPAEQPKPVNPTVQKSVEVAKTVTGVTANATGYLASKIGLATSALGRYLAPHIEKQGKRLLTSTTKMTEEEASEKVSSFLDVTSGTVEGIATVYNGLETAAGILGRSLKSNTVQVIEYKYGHPTGVLADESLDSAANLYTAYHNTRILRPKGIAKAAAKGAGQAVLEDYRASLQTQQSKTSPPHEEFQGSGPGDGSGFLPIKKS